MFVGSSVSRKEFDEVFPNCHICSLDHQCRGNNVTKFPELPYMFEYFMVLFLRLDFTGETAPTNTPWTVADEDATSCETSIPSAS